MFRLVEPASGRVIIDKHNTDQMGLHDLREELTIIPQEPVLFRLGCSQKLLPEKNLAQSDRFRDLLEAKLETVDQLYQASPICWFHFEVQLRIYVSVTSIIN